MKLTKSFHRAAAKASCIAMLAASMLLAATTFAQKFYPTPDAAVDAFIDGVSRNDYDQVRVVLGPDWTKYVPTETLDDDDVMNFLEAWSKGHRVVPSDSDKAYVEVGTHGWTMPIPLVRTAKGWRFDTRSTPDELRTRRIGRNELAVIQVVLAYTDAQEEYAQRNPDGAAARHYAQKIISSPGKRDGLYWPAAMAEKPSPLGPFVGASGPALSYYGYRYRILTAQGSGAPGGARSFVSGHLMTGGYALVAWPAKYGDTGVMSFIVNDARQVYQKDLGPDTDRIARTMKIYDPDASWEKVVVSN